MLAAIVQAGFQLFEVLSLNVCVSIHDDASNSLPRRSVNDASLTMVELANGTQVLQQFDLNLEQS